MRAVKQPKHGKGFALEQVSGSPLAAGGTRHSTENEVLFMIR